MASTASHTPIRADLQKDQTGLPFSINITADADRKLPLPASFGSCGSHALTTWVARLSSTRFRMMRGVQPYTRDAFQLHGPDLGEGHVDPR
jgi:hypothetical protein